MDVNSLGNGNFSNRQNNDGGSHDTPDNEGTTGPVSSLQNGGQYSKSTRVTPSAPAEEVLKENNTVQTNETGPSQIGEQKTGSQVDVMI